MLLLAGCIHVLGVSVELNGGPVKLEPDDGSAGALGYTAGFTIALEADESRDANLGMGFGSQRVRPGGDSAGDGISVLPMRIWFGSSTRASSEALRTRVTMGASLGNGEGDHYIDGYLGFGASLHYTAGRSIHASLGPMLMYAKDSHLEGYTRYRGFGGQLRLRYLYMFSKRCDRVASGGGGDVC